MPMPLIKRLAEAVLKVELKNYLSEQVANKRGN